MEVVKRIFGLLLFILYFDVYILIENVPSHNYNSGKILNLSIDELKHSCESNGVNISGILRNLNFIFNKQWSIASKKMWDLNSPENNTNFTQEKSPSFLLSSHCYENSDFQLIFDNVVSALQLCLESSNRLNDQEKQFLSQSAAFQVCSYIELDSLIKMTDKDCVEIMNDNKNFFPSVDNFSNEVGFPDYSILLILRRIYAPKECKTLRKYWTCQEDVMKLCKNSTNKMYESWMKERKAYIGCKEDYNTQADNQSRIFDVQKIQFKFTLPELKQMCESKGINLDVETSDKALGIWKTFDKCWRTSTYKNATELKHCVKKHCFTNYTLQFLFEEVIDSVQLCFNYEDQISMKATRTLVQKAHREFCEGRIMYGLLDVETVEDSTLRKCYMLTEILNENNVFTSPALYFIPHAYTPKECQFYLATQACVREKFDTYSNDTKKAIETVDFEYKDCERIKNITST